MEDILKVALELIAAVSAMPQLHAVLAGLLAGVAAAYAVSNFMPPDMNTSQARRITALVSGGMTLIVALLIRTTILTLAWALTMAMVAPAVYGALVRLLIKRWPWAAPASVLDCAETAAVEDSKKGKTEP